MSLIQFEVPDEVLALFAETRTMSSFVPTLHQASADEGVEMMFIGLLSSKLREYDMPVENRGPLSQWVERRKREIAEKFQETPS